MQGELEKEKTIVNWCGGCKTPILSSVNGGTCPLCGAKTKYMCADIRPVFPEERLLIELLLDKPMAFHSKSVWASRRTFYVDGASVLLKSEVYMQANADAIRREYERLQKDNNKHRCEALGDGKVCWAGWLNDSMKDFY